MHQCLNIHKKLLVELQVIDSDIKVIFKKEYTSYFSSQYHVDGLIDYDIRVILKKKYTSYFNNQYHVDGLIDCDIRVILKKKYTSYFTDNIMSMT